MTDVTQRMTDSGDFLVDMIGDIICPHLKEHRGTCSKLAVQVVEASEPILTADLRAQLAEAERRISNALAFHRPITIYALCYDNTCQHEHGEDSEDGSPLHMDEPLGLFCEDCHDGYGERTEYPCPTLAALDAALTPTTETT